MTNEQINKAVAEELGVKPYWWCPKCGEVDNGRVTYDETHDRSGCFERVFFKDFDFCTDHNAAAEMRKGIKPEETSRFTMWLGAEIDSFNLFDVLNSTPRQQAEAFLRMRWKWRDGE